MPLDTMRHASPPTPLMTAPFGLTSGEVSDGLHRVVRTRMPDTSAHPLRDVLVKLCAETRLSYRLAGRGCESAPAGRISAARPLHAHWRISASQSRCLLRFLAGALVRRGEATAQVTATGVCTKFGRTAELIRTPHFLSSQQKGAQDCSKPRLPAALPCSS